MGALTFKPGREQYVYTFGGAAPVLTVKPRTDLHLWSEDAFNNAITSVGDVASQKLDRRWMLLTAFIIIYTLFTRAFLVNGMFGKNDLPIGKPFRAEVIGEKSWI